MIPNDLLAHPSIGFLFTGAIIFAVAGACVWVYAGLLIDIRRHALRREVLTSVAGNLFTIGVSMLILALGLNAIL